MARVTDLTPRNWEAIDLDPVHTATAAGAPSAAARQISKANFLDPTEIRVFDPARDSARRNAVYRIEAPPPDARERKLGHTPVTGIAFGIVPDQIGPVSQLQDGTQQIERRWFGTPPDLRNRAAQINVIPKLSERKLIEAKCTQGRSEGLLIKPISHWSVMSEARTRQK
ncbi:MAG: hypothetical protein P8M72_08685 [Gammaproteobacteria bacterium]|nr:hypothetical protein [Gammaproteobacteria bacterium]